MKTFDEKLAAFREAQAEREARARYTRRKRRMMRHDPIRRVERRRDRAYREAVRAGFLICTHTDFSRSELFSQWRAGAWKLRTPAIAVIVGTQYASLWIDLEPARRRLTGDGRKRLLIHLREHAIGPIRGNAGGDLILFERFLIPVGVEIARDLQLCLGEWTGPVSNNAGLATRSQSSAG